MKNSERPVVVFDSGLGGISVLKKLTAVMPNEVFVYYGDSANAPYGPRELREVCRLTVEGVARLDSLQPKAVVIACNTATAAAQEALEERYPQIPVVGIEPAVGRALRENPGGRILSLATAGTLASPRYQRQLGEVAGLGEVVSAAAPGIVRYVEGGMRDRAGVMAYLGELFAPWRSVFFDGVVLGCTHFPFAAVEIRQALGYPVRLYEQSGAVAEETRRRLVGLGTDSKDGQGGVTIMNSAEDENMLHFSWQLFAWSEGEGDGQRGSNSGGCTEAV